MRRISASIFKFCFLTPTTRGTFALLSPLLLVLGCGIGGGLLTNSGECDGYPDFQSSEYILPYETGSAFQVSQGNCGSISHFGKLRYAFDFATPTGTPIIAARAGTVIMTSDTEANPDGGCNGLYVYIQHSDGTIARYLHFSQVDVGLVAVNQGDRLGLSGVSGCTAGFPHLHFEVIDNRTSFHTQKVNFRNAGGTPRSLLYGVSYTALSP